MKIGLNLLSPVVSLSSSLCLPALLSISIALPSGHVGAQSKNLKQVQFTPLTEQWTPPDYSSQSYIGYSANTFGVPNEMQGEVSFWVNIFTKYSTEQGVFHETGRIDKILGEIDLTQVFANSKWSPIRREKEAELIVKRQKKLISKRTGIDVKKIRLQMGLKDRMLKAIQLSGRYLPLMERIFRTENIPIELTRVVFVESSFNIMAGSRVGASGLWQIMPIIAKKSKYLNEANDLRQHPEYSTKLAAKILKQNYQILKSWPLAVTAYNHGVGSLRKIVKKYKSNDISYLVKNVQSKKGFGFASRNFYASYLAALHVESHANIYFPEPLFKESEFQFKDIKIGKKMKYNEILVLFDNNKALLKFYNPHLKTEYLKGKKALPIGAILTVPRKSKDAVADLVEPPKDI